MAQVLVTGGSGFIGRYLVDALLSRGDAVRVLDVAEPKGGANGFTFVRGSAADRSAAMRAVEGIEVVYHLAGIAHLWVPDKSDFDRANRLATETMLKAAAERGIGRFVHCSTESILLPKRRNGAAPIDESHAPPLADMPGPYTRSKHLAERAALKAAAAGMDAVVVNPTVPIGEGDNNLTPPAAMLAYFFSGGGPFFLDCTLNLVDVRDLAEGILLAGERGRAGERYILGGENVTLRELLGRLQRLTGRAMPSRQVPAPLAMGAGLAFGWISDRLTRRPPVATLEGVILGLRSAPFDSGKAKRELGYAARPVEEALTKAVEELKRNQPKGNRR